MGKQTLNQIEKPEDLKRAEEGDLVELIDNPIVDLISPDENIGAQLAILGKKEGDSFYATIQVLTKDLGEPSRTDYVCNKYSFAKRGVMKVEEVEVFQKGSKKYKVAREKLGEI